MPQIWCNSDQCSRRTLWHFEKIGPHHFSLIGCHLEGVSQTELVFELSPSPEPQVEERPTYEFWSDSGIFLQVIVLTLQVTTVVPGQRYKGHRQLKKEENTSFGKLVEPIQIW